MEKLERLFTAALADGFLLGAVTPKAQDEVEPPFPRGRLGTLDARDEFGVRVWYARDILFRRYLRGRVEDLHDEIRALEFLAVHVALLRAPDAFVESLGIIDRTASESMAPALRAFHEWERNVYGPAQERFVRLWRERRIGVVDGELWGRNGPEARRDPEFYDLAFTVLEDGKSLGMIDANGGLNEYLRGCAMAEHGRLRLRPEELDDSRRSNLSLDASDAVKFYDQGTWYVSTFGPNGLTVDAKRVKSAIDGVVEDGRLPRGLDAPAEYERVVERENDEDPADVVEKVESLERIASTLAALAASDPSRSIRAVARAAIEDPTASERDIAESAGLAPSAIHAARERLRERISRLR